MKAYYIRTEGKGTVLEPRELPVPTAGPGQVVVKVKAASLNRGDLLAAIAHHGAAGGRPAGADSAGEIHAVGAGVTGFKTGDAVMVRSRGSFAEYVAVAVEQVVPKPANLSFEQAASVPIAYITAWESLFQFGRLQPGETALITGASSGVGVACIQEAKAIGAKTIGISSSAEKLARLKALGLDVGIQARGGGFAEQALDATGGKGVDVAVNLVGGTAFPDCQKSLADFGRIAIVGYVDRTMTAQIDLEAVHTKRQQIFGVSNAPLKPEHRAVSMRGFVRDVLPAIVDGRIVPVIDKVFPFDQLPAAKSYVEQDTLLGKVVVTL